MKREIKELNTWSNPATLSHDEIKSLINKAIQQERERIIEMIEENGTIIKQGELSKGIYGLLIDIEKIKGKLKQ